MARYQIIGAATGRKLNIIEWDGETDYDPGPGVRLEPDDGAPIWQEPAAAPLLPDISDRQFAQVLALDGVVTEAEALAWAARGDLPAALTVAVDQLPASQRFPARMLLSAATTYERSHPLVPLLGAIIGKDTAALDSIWERGAAL